MGLCRWGGSKSHLARCLKHHVNWRTALICGNYQQSCVILELGVAKSSNLRQQPAIQLVCGECAVGFRECRDASLSRLLPVRIRRFGDTVGEQEQSVPCPQLDRRILVFPGWEDTEHCTAL